MQCLVVFYSDEVAEEEAAVEEVAVEEVVVEEAPVEVVAVGEPLEVAAPQAGNIPILPSFRLCVGLR